MAEANLDLQCDAMELSVEEMERDNVARFAAAPFYWDQFLDTKLPGFQRSQANVIGAFSNRPEASAAITRPHNFFAGFMLLPAGAKAGLHNHRTAELFMPIRGRLRLSWGAEGARSIELGPLDMISVPPGIFRGFENPGDEDLLLFGVLEGPDPGQVAWAPEVEARAALAGYRIGAAGMMERADGGDEPSAFHLMELLAAPVLRRGGDQLGA